ncbi:MAG: hypothetical protein FJX73_12730 [Armatimonadetes bacterium]|nr:hypothetical protein [Armatimonadota bacterium]
MVEAGCAEGVLYDEFLDGNYDCVDRVVLRAYFQLGQAPAGFRMFWRRWKGSDKGLDNTHLMRIAGRFARKVRGWAEGEGVPIVYSQAGERNEAIAEKYMPADPRREGVFLIIVGRAPGNVWDVVQTADGRIRNIGRKKPRSWVNHYAFHIMDREWGHVIVRFCPHPPFNAMVILNGHEWVALEAARRGVAFTKEDNCFTELSDARGLGLVADTLSSSESSVGRLVQVSERWIYSAVLCFAMDIADQERTGFRYSYSVFQAEYSRNLLFRDGRQMDQVFSGLIDRIRGPLDIRTVKTLFGRRQRPQRQKGQPRAPAEEIALEKPTYDLTILRIHFGRVTLKIYTKGGRVLRIEAMAHNIRDLRCHRGVHYFPQIMVELRRMVDRFVEVLDCVDTSFIDAGLMDEISQPGRLGAVRVGGLDINRPRIRAVMEAVVALSPSPRGFTSSELATQVGGLLADETYSPSRAAYDLRKLRCKGLVARVPRSPRYAADVSGLRAMAALLILRDRVVRPLMAAASRSEPAPQPREATALDLRYAAVHREMRNLFNHLGIAA